MPTLRLVFAVAAMTAAPLISCWANGSDIEPNTTASAVAGAHISHKHRVSHNPTVGTGGGGMATASGVKAGGLSKQNKIMQTGASN
jgi:hypothetical protein